ncbi:hypothetical protein [Desulfovibrio sp. UCD-KL4C]|uniref:hypothetical protein n=1 Tax=Desulfovibrio sp. UCD-KL4C TaxID=2578120 RepID=UPI0025C573D9|nr:hypothetical protein [Desulfovibrio sp. UCD-KL4C]
MLRHEKNNLQNDNEPRAIFLIKRDVAIVDNVATTNAMVLYLFLKMGRACGSNFTGG